MDRESRRMLRYLATFAPEACTRKAVCRTYAKQYGVPMPRVAACLDYLLEEGYLRAASFGDGSFLSIRHKGYHYRYFEWQTFLRLVGNSVLVPFVVTVLTLCATILIQSWLPAWLSALLDA